MVGRHNGGIKTGERRCKLLTVVSRITADTILVLRARRELGWDAGTPGVRSPLPQGSEQVVGTDCGGLDVHKRDGQAALIRWPDAQPFVHESILPRELTCTERGGQNATWVLRSLCDDNVDIFSRGNWEVIPC